MNPQKEKKLTQKERLFVVEYLKDLNASQAAIRAGYSKKTARYIGYENLTKPHIQKALFEARNSIEKREEKALMDARETEERLDALCRFNLKNYYYENGRPKEIHQLTDEEAACVKEIGELETSVGSHRTVKFINPLDALTKKMQRLGMLKDNKDANVTGTVFIKVKGRED
jgi:phage terminase small subunit